MTTETAAARDGNGVTQLTAAQQTRGLWQDALSRLLRNRAAVLGLIIIVLNFGVALFADQLAPRSYEKQVLALNNSSPQWIINVFPSLEAKDEEISLRGAELSVRTGDRVAADALLGYLHRARQNQRNPQSHGRHRAAGRQQTDHHAGGSGSLRYPQRLGTLRRGWRAGFARRFAGPATAKAPSSTTRN